MSRRIKKQLRQLRSVSLTTGEREHIRETLFSFMEQRPAREDAVLRRIVTGSLGSVAEMRPVPLYMRFAPVLMVLIVLSSMGGVSLAAEGAIPGEMLYPMKIHVNERVRSVLATRPDQKAAWETAQVERRLREAEALAVRGELTEERSLQLSESVTKHSLALKTSMQQMEIQGDRVVLSNIGEDAAMALEGHDEVLLGIAAGTMSTTSTNGGGQEVSRIIDALRATAKSLEEVSMAVEEAATALPVNDSNVEQTAPIEAPREVIDRTERRYKQAEHHIAGARAYVKNNKTGLSELIVLQAGRIIRRAEDELHQGEELLSRGEYVPAGEAFLEAYRLAKRALLLAETNFTFEVEVDIESDRPTDEGPAETPPEESNPGNSSTEPSPGGETSETPPMVLAK